MWMMNRLWRVPLFLLVAVVALSAQEANVTSDTAVDQATLHQWLHSSDPRLIAWAADFARRKHEATILGEMPELLEHWAMPPDNGGDEALPAQRRAVLSILDALIQENVEVPIPAIEAVARLFPSQAAILIGRSPLSQSRRTLDDWTYGATGTWGRTLARIASMMLAKDPRPSTVVWNRNLIGFVASVVDASEEDIEISVRDTNLAGSGFGSGVGCGDSFGHKLTPGWPEVYTYGLDEANNRKISGQIVVDLAGDQIFSQRRKENDGWGSCGGGVEALDPATRHRLIAYWLRVPERDMSWQPTESFTIRWTNKTAYEAQLGKIIESERRKLYDTVETLRHQGLLKKEELAMPHLEVMIRCDMTPCPLQ